MPRSDAYNPLYEEIGARIARARRAAGLSQAKLAATVAVTRTSIVNIERGRQRPPIHLVWDIADALGIEAADLVPRRRELTVCAAPVQLDPAVVASIEKAARDDPGTRRRLLDFIQHATTRIGSPDASVQTRDSKVR